MIADCRRWWWFLWWDGLQFKELPHYAL